MLTSLRETIAIDPLTGLGNKKIQNQLDKDDSIMHKNGNIKNPTFDEIL